MARSLYECLFSRTLASPAVGGADDDADNESLRFVVVLSPLSMLL